VGELIFRRNSISTPDKPWDAVSDGDADVGRACATAFGFPWVSCIIAELFAATIGR
jgi:hypothetical protein